MEIIPSQSVALLPFHIEPLSNWTEGCDLYRFLYSLFDQTTIATNAAGETFEINYSSYGKHLFEKGIERLILASDDFYKNASEATPVPATERQVEDIPYFSEDDNFSLVAKYAIAWDSVLSAVLSESAFFSLAHVLETDTELNSSMLLASNLYYKQALQVLRNFLEEVVVELHFCANPNVFEGWKSGRFRMPRFRGKSGMLRELVSEKLLSEELASVASNLYENLNGSIHGAEDRLVHTGIFTGNNAGLLFKYDRFTEWARYFSECVDFGIQVRRLTVNYWAQSRPDDRIQCNVCHQEDFNVENDIFAGHSYLKLTCRNCGSSMTVDSEWAARRGYE